MNNGPKFNHFLSAQGPRRGPCAFWPLRFSTDNALQDLAQGLLICGGKGAEGFAQQRLLGGEQDGLEYGRLQQPRAAPVGDERFAESQRWPYLAGDRQQQERFQVHFLTTQNQGLPRCGPWRMRDCWRRTVPGSLPDCS